MLMCLTKKLYQPKAVVLSYWSPFGRGRYIKSDCIFIQDIVQMCVEMGYLVVISNDIFKNMDVVDEILQVNYFGCEWG